jgi:hypothetical protein
LREDTGDSIGDVDQTELPPPAPLKKQALLTFIDTYLLSSQSWERRGALPVHWLQSLAEEVKGGKESCEDALLI